MREIKIKGKVYVIKFTYKAAKCQDCVQKAFELVTGATVMKAVGSSDNPTMADMISGVSTQVAEIPSLCDIFMFAGLKAENPVSTVDEAGDLLIEYMEETGKNYNDIFNSFKDCMEEDGFFEKAGIDKMVENMNDSIEEALKENQTETPAKKTTKKKVTPET